MKLNDYINHSGDVGNDRELLVRLSSGHEPSFGVIYNRYWKMVYHAANKMLQSPSQAQDVVQEVFSTIWAQRQNFAEVENLEAYIRAMARNRIYSELRAWSKEQRNIESYVSQAPTSVDDCDFAILNVQNEQLLEEILNLLPPRQREVFTLSRKEGLSHEQIAEMLNVSSGTVKNHMVRALQTIRAHMEPHLGIRPLHLILFLLFQ